MCTYCKKDWSSEDRYYRYEDPNHDIQDGNILIPDEAGTYPVLVLFHGMGGACEWQNNGIIDNLNNWISEFDFKPMVVIMPTVPKDPSDPCFPKYGSDSYYHYVRDGFGNLLKMIKDDTRFNSYIIDDPEHSAVAGASMGGAAALYAGILYRDTDMLDQDKSNKYMHVGGFSPSQQLYIDSDHGWIRDPDQLIFSHSAELCQFMGYSTGEPVDFNLYVSNYKKVFDKNNNNFQIYKTNTPGHNYGTFNKELFAFLYLLNKKELPNDEVINSSVL